MPFPSQDGLPYNAVPGQTYYFQDARLEAEHPPIDAMDNRVATTGWVLSKLTGSPMLPTVHDAGGLTISIHGGVVDTPIGTVCNVPDSIAPISVVANTVDYVYVRYSDCAVVVNTRLPNALEGRPIAEVHTDATRIVRIENYASYNLWATTASPFFTGDPRAPHPPEGDYDHSIPTTKWVIDAFNRLLRGESPTLSPRVVDAGGLRVNVTRGEVIKPTEYGEDCICEIEPLPVPISIIANAGVNGNPTEKVWVRYSDCAVVASTSFNPLYGELLGEVSTDNVRITRIQQAISQGTNILADSFVVGFGGRLIPKPTDTP